MRKTDVSAAFADRNVNAICDAVTCKPEIFECVPDKSAQTWLSGWGWFSDAWPENRQGLSGDPTKQYFTSAFQTLSEYLATGSPGASFALTLSVTPEVCASASLARWLQSEWDSYFSHNQVLHLQFRENDLVGCKDTQRMLNRLNDSGINVSIEKVVMRSDFDLLASPAVKLVQLDRLFVDHYLDSLSRSVVSGLSTLCSELGKQMVVDGVDSEAKLEAVHRVKLTSGFAPMGETLKMRPSCLVLNVRFATAANLEICVYLIKGSLSSEFRQSQTR